MGKALGSSPHMAKVGGALCHSPDTRSIRNSVPGTKAKDKRNLCYTILVETGYYELGVILSHLYEVTHLPHSYRSGQVFLS